MWCVTLCIMLLIPPLLWTMYFLTLISLYFLCVSWLWKTGVWCKTVSSQILCVFPVFVLCKIVMFHPHRFLSWWNMCKLSVWWSKWSSFYFLNIGKLIEIVFSIFHILKAEILMHEYFMSTRQRAPNGSLSVFMIVSSLVCVFPACQH